MEPVAAARIVSNLKQDYARMSADGSQRFTESMIRLIQNLQKPGGTLQKYLDDVVQLMNRAYKLREVSMGLYYPADKTYRYVSVCGFRKDAEASLRALVYREKDFEHEEVGKQISDWTWVFLSENKPFETGEESTYNRPIMLERGDRRSPDQCLEADYFDTRIFNRRNEFVGWIEYSGTMDYRLPEMRVIKEIELIAGITSLVLECHGQR